MRRLLFVIVLLLSTCLPVFSQRQTLDNISTSLDELESTLLDIQNENEALKADTEALKQNLSESEAAAGKLLVLSAKLKRLSSEQAEAFRRQSASLELSERRLKRWRLASLIEGAALISIVLGDSRKQT
jgi:outer membrane murein-binding lipoprotein Lpp